MNVGRMVHIAVRDFALYSRPLRLDDIHNTNHGRILEEKTRWRHRWRPIRIPADSYKASDNPILWDFSQSIPYLLLPRSPDSDGLDINHIQRLQKL